MLELEENLKKIEILKNKIQSLGESLWHWKTRK